MCANLLIVGAGIGFKPVQEGRSCCISRNRDKCSSRVGNVVWRSSDLPIFMANLAQFFV